MDDNTLFNRVIEQNEHCQCRDWTSLVTYKCAYKKHKGEVCELKKSHKIDSIRTGPEGSSPVEQFWLLPSVVDIKLINKLVNICGNDCVSFVLLLKSDKKTAQSPRRQRVNACFSECGTLTGYRWPCVAREGTRKASALGKTRLKKGRCRQDWLPAENLLFTDCLAESNRVGAKVPLSNTTAGLREESAAPINFSDLIKIPGRQIASDRVQSRLIKPWRIGRLFSNPPPRAILPYLFTVIYSDAPHTRIGIDMEKLAFTPAHEFVIHQLLLTAEVASLAEKLCAQAGESVSRPLSADQLQKAFRVLQAENHHVSQHLHAVDAHVQNQHSYDS